MSRRRVLAALLGGLAAAAPLAAGAAAPADAVGRGEASAVALARIVYFQTPSRNVGCAYLPVISPGDRPTLRCEIRSRLRPLPPRPRGCGDAVWGEAVAMTRTGRAGGICISDTIREPSAPILAYGRVWRVGGFTCVSKATDLSCTNLTRHGWTLSRARSSIR